MADSTDFISLLYLKKTLGIPDSKTNNDDTLLDITSIANQEVDMRIKPYAESIPLEPATDLYIQAQKAAARYARSLWYERNGQLDRAEHSDKIYEEKMKALIQAIISEKAGRQKTVFISGRDPLDRIYQPTNTGEYVTREFF